MKPTLALQFNTIMLGALTLLLYACTLSSPKLEGIDTSKWKEDAFGCKGDRETLLPLISDQQSKLLGFNQNEIKYYLGKPDEQELYDRSQTFFHYYIRGHSSCGSSDSTIAPIVMQIRFNALNSSNEVFFKNYLIEESF